MLNLRRGVITKDFHRQSQNMTSSYRQLYYCNNSNQESTKRIKLRISLLSPEMIMVDMMMNQSRSWCLMDNSLTANLVVTKIAIYGFEQKIAIFLIK